MYLPAVCHVVPLVRLSPPPVYLPAVCHVVPLVRLPPPPVYLPAVCHVVPLVRLPFPLCTYQQCAMLCHWSDYCATGHTVPPCVPTSSVPCCATGQTTVSTPMLCPGVPVYLPAVCHVVPLVRLPPPPCVPTSSVPCCATGQTAMLCHQTAPLCTYQQCAMLCHWSDCPPCVPTSSVPCCATGQTQTPPPVYLPAVCHVVPLPFPLVRLPLVRPPPCVPTSSVPCCATGQTVPSPPPATGVPTSSVPCCATGQTTSSVSCCATGPPPVYLPAVCHVVPLVRLPPPLCTYQQCAMLCHWSDYRPAVCHVVPPTPPPPVYLPAVCHVVPLVRPCCALVPPPCTYQQCAMLCHWSDCTYQQCAMLCHWSTFPPPLCTCSVPCSATGQTVYLPAVCHVVPLVRLPPPPVYLPAVCHVVPLVRLPPPLCTYQQCAMLCHWSGCPPALSTYQPCAMLCHWSDVVYHLKCASHCQTPSPCVPTSSVPCCATGQTATGQTALPPVYLPAVCHVVSLVRLPFPLCTYQQCAMLCHWSDCPPCVPTSSVPCCATGQTTPPPLCTYQQCAMLCHWSDCPPPYVPTSSVLCCATGQTTPPPPVYLPAPAVCQCAMLCHGSDYPPPPPLCTYLPAVCHVVPLVRLPPPYVPTSSVPCCATGAMLCHWSDCPPPCVPTSSVPCCATTAPPLCTHLQCAMFCHWSDCPSVYLPAVCHVVPLVRPPSPPPRVPTSSVPCCAMLCHCPPPWYQQCAMLCHMLCHWSPPPCVPTSSVPCCATGQTALPPVYLPAVCHVVSLVRLPFPLCTYQQCAMLCHWSDCPSPCVPTSSVHVCHWSDCPSPCVPTSSVPCCDYQQCAMLCPPPPVYLPAVCHVVPLVRLSLSRSTASVMPFFARWYSVLHPLTPPPTTTTSAQSGKVVSSALFCCDAYLKKITSHAY